MINSACMLIVGVFKAIEVGNYNLIHAKSILLLEVFHHNFFKDKGCILRVYSLGVLFSLLGKNPMYVYMSLEEHSEEYIQGSVAR